MSDNKECREKLAESLREFKERVMDIPHNYIIILDKKFEGVLSHFDTIVQHADENGMVDFNWLREDTIRASAEINEALLKMAPSVASTFIEQHTPNTKNYIERLEFFAKDDNGRVSINLITLELKKLMQRSCRDFIEAYMMDRIESFNVEEAVIV
jgi:hypothetical protein